MVEITKKDQKLFYDFLGELIDSGILRVLFLLKINYLLVRDGLNKIRGEVDAGRVDEEAAEMLKSELRTLEDDLRDIKGEIYRIIEEIGGKGLLGRRKLDNGKAHARTITSDLYELLLTFFEKIETVKNEYEDKTGRTLSLPLPSLDELEEERKEYLNNLSKFINEYKNCLDRLKRVKRIRISRDHFTENIEEGIKEDIKKIIKEITKIFLKVKIKTWR